MATVVQTKMQRFLSSAGWRHFVRSNYVTWFTEWLLSLGGKSAHVILIFTTLYMSAELYPGVKLPDGVSIAVFLIQMFALDMGGMGLASLSRQAHTDGNEEGARSAKNLSNWLIGIMIAGLVTVCLEQAMNHLPHMETVQGYVDAAKIFVELVLVIARAVCAVLYGKVIHTLRGSWTIPTPTVQPEPVDYSQIIEQMRVFYEPQFTRISEQLANLSVNTQTFTPPAPVVNTSPNIPVNTEVTPEQTISPHRTVKLSEQERDTGEIVAVNTGANKKVRRAKVTSINTGDAVKRIERVLRRNPTISVTELAKQAKVSRGYASQKRNELQAKVRVAVEQ